MNEYCLSSLLSDAGRLSLLEIITRYTEEAILLTTAQLELPGPQILYVNSAFTRMTGYALADVVGKTPRILQGVATDRETLDRLKSDLESGGEFTGRTKNYRSDGTEFEIQWKINPIRNLDGITTHFLAIQRDITGQQLAENEIQEIDSALESTGNQLIQSLRDLERMDRRLVRRERLCALGEMAAGVAHDINNALFPLSALVHRLSKLDNLTENECSCIGVLEKSTEHAVNLIKNLQYFYMADPQGQESAEVEFDSDGSPRAPLSIVDVIHSVKEITRPKWQNAGTESSEKIEFQIQAEQFPLVLGNETELRQALVNLVFNAVDAMNSGGVLQFNLSKASPDEIVLEVLDTGCGMTHEVAERCFEPYYSTKESGSGFGLSICHGIIQRHHGRIEVTSKLGEGTAFQIFLPTAKAPNKQGPHFFNKRLDTKEVE